MAVYVPHSPDWSSNVWGWQPYYCVLLQHNACGMLAQPNMMYL